MTGLFDPITIRGLEIPHRAWLSPMCQYSADLDLAPGVPTDWHLMHLGQFAAGGAGLIMTEAAAVVPEGRISPWDVGLYNEAQQGAWRRIVDSIHQFSAVGGKVGIQLAHAGRKASVYRPWSAVQGSVPRSEGGWGTQGPTAIPFTGYAAPEEMSEEQILEVVAAFATSAQRAIAAGFDAIEIHGAHGYLLHQFLSPLSNTRTDQWGGTEHNRWRFPLAVIDAVRSSIPDSVPLFLRVSASDWYDGGLTPESVGSFGREAGSHGVDLIDVSSGGLLAEARVEVAPGYQTGFAAVVREISGLPVSTVGLITAPEQAEQAIVTGQADTVMIARAALRDPHWWLRAAHDLGSDLPWPPQYQRAQTRRAF